MVLARDEPTADELVCREDMIRVRAKPVGTVRAGMKEVEDPKNWIHMFGQNHLGNPDCGKRALTDDEVGPYSEAG